MLIMIDVSNNNNSKCSTNKQLSYWVHILMIFLFTTVNKPFEKCFVQLNIFFGDNSIKIIYYGHYDKKITETSVNFFYFSYNPLLY